MKRRGATVLISSHDTPDSESNNNCHKTSHHHHHHHGNECTRWPMYTLVGFVSFVCYVNGFSGDFVHDDIPAVTLNKDVLALNPIAHIFMNDFWGTPMADVNSHKSYRPLTTLTFRVEIQSSLVQRIEIVKIHYKKGENFVMIVHNVRTAYYCMNFVVNLMRSLGPVSNAKTPSHAHQVRLAESKATVAKSVTENQELIHPITMMWVITFIFVVVFYFYWTFIRPLSTWKQMNIPYIKGYPLVGNFLWSSLKVKSFADDINSIYKALPNEKYCGSFMFAQPRLLIRDADLLKQIGIKDFDNFTDHTKIFFGESFDSLFDKNLFSLNGQEWRDMRATLSPAFTGSKMRLIFTLINECGHQLTSYLNDRNNSEKGSHLDIELKDLFTRFTNDVIATTAFGIKCDSLKEPENEFYLMGRETSYFSTIRLFFTNVLPRLMKFLEIGILPKHCCDYFRNLVNKTVDARERQKIVRPDMLNLLIQAKNGVLKNDDKVEEISGFAVAHEGKVNGKIRKLTEDDVSAQAFIFFLAGFDTVSTAMCFTVYELALNPDIQDRLYSEIVKSFEGSNNGDITYETVQKMKYLDMVISESLRKWPPAAIIDRQCTRPYQLRTDGKSVDVTLGTGILVPIYGIHRDPKYYPNPEKFDPERFNDENKGKINLNAYLPFGMGPRICIASRFALMETKILIVHLIKNFEVIVTNKSTVPARLSAKSTNMQIENGFNVGLRARK